MDVSGSGRISRGLVVTVLVALTLVVGGVAAVALLTSGDDGDESVMGAPATPAAPAPSGSLGVAERTEVTAAAKTVLTKILNLSSDKYDAQVAAAARLMTPSMAAQYRKETTALRDEFLTLATDHRISDLVVAMVAGDVDRPQILAWTRQTASRDGAPATTTPARALLTMVRSDDTWLLDELDSNEIPKAPAPAPEPDPARRAALQAATEMGTAYTNINHRSVDADTARVQEQLTGTLEQDCRETLPDLRRQVREQETVFTGEVLAVGAVDFDDDRATVLVIADGTWRNKSTKGKGSPVSTRWN